MINRIIRRPAGVIARKLMGTITQVRTDQHVAALTFDDGPDPQYTLPLLEVLERHGARATFFMLGQRARQYPELVQRVAAGGHAIGNHTFDHHQMPLINSLERYRQIRRCNRAIAPYGQQLFRPPKGRQNIRSRFILTLMGYQVVTWSVQAEDWLIRDSDWMANRLEDQIIPGTIVLLHDSIWDPFAPETSDRSAMIAAIDTLLTRRSSLYRFVTVPELLRCGEVIREHWYMPPVPDNIAITNLRN
ncbi:MAG: polysaccharide deacetylase family protein [Roseiflexaceae bacterium]|nr:polysaccharide deacetylase family protein [Roseiflexaceae bacterium]